MAIKGQIESFRTGLFVQVAKPSGVKSELATSFRTILVLAKAKHSNKTLLNYSNIALTPLASEAKGYSV